jgi:simple sugar transport system ATP-binding protein
VLLISEDLDEVLALSDRIAVLFSGQIIGTVAATAATAEQLGLMMAGRSYA